MDAPTDLLARLAMLHDVTAEEIASHATDVGLTIKAREVQTVAGEAYDALAELTAEHGMYRAVLSAIANRELRPDACAAARDFQRMARSADKGAQS